MGRRKLAITPIVSDRARQVRFSGIPSSLGVDDAVKTKAWLDQKGQ